MKRNYVGIDLDTHNQLVLLKTLINAKAYGEVMYWETRKGYHVRIILKQPLTEKDTLKIRTYLGDDMNRIMLDEWRIQHGLEHYDVLFTSPKRSIKK